MILISGATGMIGSHLAYKLLSNGEQLRAMKRQSSSLQTIEKVFSYRDKNYKQLLDKIEWVDCDITDPEAVSEAMKDVDYVYHTAAIVSFSDTNRAQIIQNNVEGTKNMVNSAVRLGVKKFCHVSSSSALGDVPDGEIITEKSMRNPKISHSGYSESKYLSELEVWRAINEGLNAVIVNPTIILGEGNWSSGSSQIFKTVADGLKFYPPGLNAFVDVLDVVDIMTGLMSSNISGERFVVAGHNLSFKQMFGMIARSFGMKEPNTKATSFLLGMAWRLEAFLSLFRKGEARITSESVKSSQKLLIYSNDKITQSLDFKFRNMEDTVARITKNYKNGG